MVLGTQTLCISWLLCVSGFSQRKATADKVLAENLTTHTGFLAGSALAGRRIGTKSETVAKDYIIKIFLKEGLELK